jgi:hypothetical protein
MCKPLPFISHVVLTCLVAPTFAPSLHRFLFLKNFLLAGPVLFFKVCGGLWQEAAHELFKQNGLDELAWKTAVKASLEDGRQKGNVVCLAGSEGNEGKSFLFAPLAEVFGQSGVFGTPTKSSFPLLGLENARVVLLDDWRLVKLQLLSALSP